MSRYDDIDRLALIYERQVKDTAPVWETEFEGGTGLVCSVSDAARAIAHHWAGSPIDSSADASDATSADRGTTSPKGG